MIEKLTPEQTKLMDEIREEFIKIGFSTNRPDRAATEQAVRNLYKAAKLEEPQSFMWVLDPLQAAVAAGQLIAGETDLQKVNEFAKKLEIPKKKLDSSAIFNNISYDNYDVSWIAFYHFFRQIGVKDIEAVDDFVVLCKNICWWFAFDKVSILSELPIAIHRDAQNRLHHMDKPAVEYASGYKIYFVNGIVVPSHFIEKKNEMTFKMIKDQQNLELRRIMVDLFGRDRYLKEIKAKIIDHDERYGILWRGEDGEGRQKETVSFVEVTNRTEEHGQFRKFFIRVPPEMQTAHQAVAWTFYKTPETYNPTHEA